MTKPRGFSLVMNGLVSAKTSASCCWEANIVERLITCTLMTTLWCSVLHPTDWLWLHIPQTPTVRDELDASFSCQTDFPLSVRVLLRVFARLEASSSSFAATRYQLEGKFGQKLHWVNAQQPSGKAIHRLTVAVGWPWCILFVLPGSGLCSPEKLAYATFTLKNALAPH